MAVACVSICARKVCFVRMLYTLSMALAGERSGGRRTSVTAARETRRGISRLADALGQGPFESESSGRPGERASRGVRFAG